MKINDIDSHWLNESEHDNFKFKKIGIDKFKTFVEVRGKKYPVIVYKNGNRWVASYFDGALIKSADTKRFATLEIRNAMRRDRKFFESLDKVGTYDNWSMHNQNTIKSDFSEYKHKEERKWKERADKMGFRFPIFEDEDHYTDELKNGTIITVDDETWDEVVHLSTAHSLDELRDIVSGYVHPRDIDRIIHGFQNNVEMPLPVMLKGHNGMFIMSGNTRLNVARLMGVTPKAIVVDVSD